VLDVTERFAGDVADRVEVTQRTGGDPDLSSVPFEQGEDYLVGWTHVNGRAVAGRTRDGLRGISADPPDDRVRLPDIAALPHSED
jgi:hypothetical protein